MVTASGTPLFKNQSHNLHGEQPGKLQVSPAELILQQDMIASPAT